MMIIVVPASVAKSAAISFVVIPPVPTSDPAPELVLTWFLKEAKSSTIKTGSASGFSRGLSVYRQSTSVIRNR
ncbi:hypothetical protein WICPIJ_001733 [Wickerhamomyces pijperi]|uniref:Uncharacterized protein n=1 Tax=Wickerhamomyces pijperi TaxID=599730 RepID=A0A9P8TQA6_WICPI|nr:hypothetical protein WICPIJ_001733 [Wickerhamomyces pijperi]